MCHGQGLNLQSIHPPVNLSYFVMMESPEVSLSDLRLLKSTLQFVSVPQVDLSLVQARTCTFHQIAIPTRTRIQIFHILMNWTFAIKNRRATEKISNLKQCIKQLITGTIARSRWNRKGAQGRSTVPFMKIQQHQFSLHRIILQLQTMKFLCQLFYQYPPKLAHFKLVFLIKNE